MSTNQELWQRFGEKHQLIIEQLQQFQQYYQLLVEWNELFNLTAITQLSSVINLHFDDSLILGAFIDLSTVETLADVGTGAGFPAIPLKIKYPHLKIILIEVSFKKRQFLQEVIEQLGLANVEISELDWRTFLRKTNYSINLFCARASLQPEELIRLFQPASPYKHAQLVYWASAEWQSGGKEAPFITKIEPYQVKSRKRALVFMKEKK